MKGTPSVILAVSLLLLAGCTTTEKASLDAGNPQATVQVDNSHGALKGLVTDTELTVISGADVGLRELQLTTKTSSRGEFLLNNLAPGVYTLDVSKLGYRTKALQVEVEAGQTATKNVQLEPIPLPGETFYETFTWTGHYTCALGSEVWVSSCTYPYTAVYYSALGVGVNLTDYGLPNDLQDNRFRTNFTVRNAAVAVVSEMSWQATSAASKQMQIILSCPKYDPVLDDCPDADSYASVGGESPIKIQWKPSKVHFTKEVNWVMARGYLPFYQAQVALDQKFDIYNTVFYGDKPSETFSMVQAGS